MLFGWLLLASLLGILAGVPWTLAVLRDHPETAWWWEGAFDLIFLTAASAAGTWLGKRVDLGSGLRELVLRTPGCWKHIRSALAPGALVGLALGLLSLISQGVVPKDALIPGVGQSERPGIDSQMSECGIDRGDCLSLRPDKPLRVGHSVSGKKSGYPSAITVDRQPAVSPGVRGGALPATGASTIWLEPLDSIRSVEHQCRYDYGLALHAIRPGFSHCRPSCR